MSWNSNRPPLSEKQINAIEMLSSGGWDCEFWRLPRVKDAIRKLVAHIRYLEKRNNILQRKVDDWQKR